MVRALQRIVKERKTHPLRIQADNGPEFISLALDRWAYDSRVTLDFSRPGKPTDNAFIESFNGSLRDECLNTNWLMSSMTRAQSSKTGGRITIISGLIHH